MLKLHFAPNSRAGRIVWLLEELDLPYEINKMAFHPKDLKSDEHRGGIVFALAEKFSVPIRYIGVGEAVDDLQPFVAEEFVSALLGQSQGE